MRKMHMRVSRLKQVFQILHDFPFYWFSVTETTCQSSLAKAQ